MERDLDQLSVLSIGAARRNISKAAAGGRTDASQTFSSTATAQALVAIAIELRLMRKERENGDHQ